MCQRTGTPPALVCTVGDLLPGAEYHDPNGETWMVLNLPRTAEDTIVVNTGNRRGGNPNTFGNALNNDELKGLVTAVRSNLRLGYDRDGRFYASTFLNGWYCEPDEAVDLGTPPQAPPDDRTYTYNPDDPEGLNTTTMGDI